MNQQIETINLDIGRTLKIKSMLFLIEWKKYIA